jgi:hypothetical protein
MGGLGKRRIGWMRRGTRTRTRMRVMSRIGKRVRQQRGMMRINQSK